MPTSTNHISLVAGESLHEIAWSIVDATGAAVDLTGYTARLDQWTPSVEPTRSDSTLVRSLSSTGGSPQLSVSGSTVALTTTSAQSATWAVAELEYTLWLTPPSGREAIASQGRFTIRKR